MAKYLQQQCNLNLLPDGAESCYFLEAYYVFQIAQSKQNEVYKEMPHKIKVLFLDAPDQ